MKREDLFQQAIKTHLIGTNKDAVKHARLAAIEEGLTVKPTETWLEGEAREVGKKLVQIARNQLMIPGQCLIWGGETTVTVKGSGRGGRNQELVLAALNELNEDDTYLILSGGTDGIDGPTDAAGAIAGFHSRVIAKGLGLDPLTYLKNNDAYTFFDRIGGLLKTGSTHTNVMDLTIVCNPPRAILDR